PILRPPFDFGAISRSAPRRQDLAALMRPALLRVCAGLYPESRLVVELLPGRKHGLLRSAPREHDQSDAVGCGFCRRDAGSPPLNSVLGQRFGVRRDLSRAIDPLFGRFSVAADALAGVALHRIAPRARLACTWL